MRIINDIEQIINRHFGKTKKINNNDDDPNIISNPNTSSSSSTLSNRHLLLSGRERLCNIVHCLSMSCPWTESISSKEMLHWLRSELDEIEKEINDIDSMKAMLEECYDHGNLKEENMINNDVHQDKLLKLQQLKAALTSEMGDILFDALMLNMMIQRDYNLNDDATWDAASEKVERRTPYMKEWGDGRIATTAEEAEIIWQEVKKEEKTKSAIQRNKEQNNFQQNNDNVEEKKYGEDEVFCIKPADDCDNKETTSRSNVTIKQNEKNNERHETRSKGEHATPVLGSTFVRFTYALGLKNIHHVSVLASSSLGFVAGALFMFVLQKVRNTTR